MTVRRISADRPQGVRRMATVEKAYARARGALGFEDWLTEKDDQLLLIRIYQGLDKHLPDDVDKRRWFNAFNHHLDGVPATLCTSASGLKATVEYLEGFPW